jgi:SSS family solute:Na+ symporter
VLVFTVSTLSPDQALAGIPFMMMAFYLFLACVAIQVAVTLAKPAITTESNRTVHLCWKSPLEPLRAPGWPGIGNYKVLSALVIGGMIVLYTFFH